MITLKEAMKLVDGMNPKEKMEGLDRINRSDVILLDDGTVCKSDGLHKLIKIDTLRKCKRIDSTDFEEQYNVVLGAYGKVIEISEYKNVKYYLLVEGTGNVHTLQVKRDSLCLFNITINYISTTCSDIYRHHCCDVNGSKHLFKTSRNAQMYEHVIIAIAYGLYDYLTCDEIYSLLINHMDGNMFNNHIDNLELCTYQENVIHGHIVNWLNNLGLKCIISAKKAMELRNCTEEQLLELFK